MVLGAKMIETTITKIQYDADGVQRRWSIPFPYADAKHISIYTKVGEEPTVKVVDNYDIDEDDSVVIYPTVASGQEPLTTGTKIIIARETPETQLEDASQVHFTSEDVERGLDKLTMITQELSTTASETMEVSADAFEAAEEAVNSAAQANRTAEEAKTIAGQAVSTANDANATATAANTKSDTAIKIANDANEKSTAAVSTANTAKTVADEANSTANKANVTAIEAKEIAVAANTTANNADKTANEADKKADNAVIVANNAKNIAEGIDAKATQALTNSNIAVSTANSAKQIAEGIDGKATQALANSTTALETATDAKNTADSYQGQITTIESKIPADASDTNQLADKKFVQDLTSVLNFVQWVAALPEAGESKYIYAVPREETDTDGKQIAALYLWDGSAWRGAGAFSLNIDPDTLATKTEVANNYLPKKNPVASGTLVVQPVLELRNAENGNWIKATMSDVVYVGGPGQKNDIAFADDFVLRRRLNGVYNDKVLWTSNKAVAYGVASLDENAKLPESQLPDKKIILNNDVLLEDVSTLVDVKKIYQQKLDDSLYCADKRFSVTLENFTSKSSYLFDGNNDTYVSLPKGQSGSILIEGNYNLGGGYPYGYIYVLFFYGCGLRDISNITCRIYQNWPGHNVGWITLKAEEVQSQSYPDVSKLIGVVRFANKKYYGIEKIELTLDNTEGTSSIEGTDLRVSSVCLFKTRAYLSNLPVMTKWGNDTIYGNLTLDKASLKITSPDGNHTGVINTSNDGFIHIDTGLYLSQKTTSLKGSPIYEKDKAVANGVASLDENAKIPENQLPDAVANQAILREW